MIRALAFSAPIAVAIVASLWLSPRLPYPESILGLGLWWLALIAFSSLVLFVVDRLTRRLLPLATLLRLTMVFPDQAPSRFGFVLRSGSSVKRLEERIEAAESDDVANAARRILELVDALARHDPTTRGHSERVWAYAELIAQEMHISEAERDRFRWAALLHDIGKLKISSEILQKTGPLTAAEWSEIMRHPEYGTQIARNLMPWLGEWGRAILDHHERWAGGGYPRGLSGEEISRAGRILAVADAYDVMTSVRPYRDPMPADKAREELARRAGTHFDPAAVRAFLTVSVGRLRWVAGPLTWLAQSPLIRIAGAVEQVGTAVGAAGMTAATLGVATIGGFVDLAEPVIDAPPPPPIEATAAAPVTSTLAAATPDARIATLVDSPVAFDAGETAIRIVSGAANGTVSLEDGSAIYVPDPGFIGTDIFVIEISEPGRGPTHKIVEVVVSPPTTTSTIQTTSTEAATTTTTSSTTSTTVGTTTTAVSASSSTTLPPTTTTTTLPPTTTTTTTLPPTTTTTTTLPPTTTTLPPTTTTVPTMFLIDDWATTRQNKRVEIRQLDNDSPLVDQKSVWIAIDPAHGTILSIGADGHIKYLPDAGFVGSDTFVYGACDESGLTCLTATVTIDVTP
jgi:putative nucleotidyltransferase with HDIG domain